MRWVLLCAVLGLVSGMPGNAVAQTGSSCALMQSARDDAVALLGERMAAASQAHAAFLSEQEEANVAFASFMNELIDFSQSRRAEWIEFMIRPALVDIEVARREAKAAEAAYEAALRSVVVQSQLVLALSAATDAACAEDPTGQTVDPKQPAAAETDTAQPTATATDAAQPPASQDLADPGAPTIQSGFWVGTDGDYYYAAGNSFYRLDREGTLSITLNCNLGVAYSRMGTRGTACEGSWYWPSGAFGGRYEAVLFVRESDDQLRIEGGYGFGDGPADTEFNLGLLTSAQVAELGLTFNPQRE